jgi:hypothetical protein
MLVPEGLNFTVLTTVYGEGNALVHRIYPLEEYEVTTGV